MEKLHGNNLGSVVLDHPTPGGGRQFKIWSATFRRIILDTVRCGTRHHHKHNNTGKLTIQEPKPEPGIDLTAVTTLRSELSKGSTSSGRSGTKYPTNTPPSGSDKLSDLLKLSEKENEPDEEEAEAVKRKVEALEELKTVVKNLQSSSSGSSSQQLEENENHGFLAPDVRALEAAKEVRRLAKGDSQARTTLALLGAIPPLVALLDAPPLPPDVCPKIPPLYALLNLGIGNDANKAAIVKSGAVHKMLKLIESENGPHATAVAEAIVANFLSLTALDANKLIIGSSGAIPFLIRILREDTDDHEKNGSQAKQDALRALYNLSISPLNLSLLLDAHLVPCLLSRLGDMDFSERILSILSNLVSIPEGRKAVSCVPDAFPMLIDVLNWTDSPGCQERGSYVLMVMAHKSYGDRQAMIEAGITSSLLELTLLGTTLAQKRASRILECLTVDKGKQISESYGGGLNPTLSAPLCAAKSSSSCADQSHQSEESLEEEDQMLSEERKAVKLLVQQSLQNNMKRIVRRANLPHDFVPSDHFMSLTWGSTSKSLPF
ncbi:U-box domain-containing protein 4-like [Coffea eugenioides]|uniref:U-box domain-containing protein 4-like n=1 Tax=Coffea eugenioides TaxID=49369 RepID=UPI000F612ED0|nr:U-box domain-containing protein 4-like [Coffea eugenioides]XP_027180355.1 U-box domain-containing protein 4-like [Coffea eugenioides]